MNVLIVQLLPRQFAWLQTVYGGPHHLTFIDSGARMSGAQVARKAGSADRVIVITKFMSHKQWDGIPREKMIFAESVNMERLLEIIDALPADQTPPKPKTQPLIAVSKREHNDEGFPVSATTTREVDGFVLTTAVPLPEGPGHGKERAGKYPFAAMKPGESFFIKTANDVEKKKVAQRLWAATGAFKKEHPRAAFVVSGKLEGGVRCWRVEDRDPIKRKSPAKSAKAASKKAPPAKAAHVVKGTNGKERPRAVRQ